jgi:hypothetical protein
MQAVGMKIGAKPGAATYINTNTNLLHRHRNRHSHHHCDMAFCSDAIATLI